MISEEEAIIIGTLLGDGHLARMKTCARLEVVHSERQKAYVMWKYWKLKRFISSAPHSITINDKRYRKQYHQLRFKTRGDELFTEFHYLFYRDKKKIVPKTIASFLNSPLSLAVWFMDDGGRRNDSYGLFLNTLSFTKQENELLIDCLLRNFSLKARLHWVQDGYRLYIPSSFAPRFCTIVYPYIIPSMRYKLSYNPVTTSYARLDRARDRKKHL